MKNIFRILPFGCTIILMSIMVALTSCEGGDLFDVDSPDWISSVADSIANSGSSSSDDEEELEGQMEDVYTFGETDYSSGWWTAFSKYYVIPDGEMWQAQFTLYINPDDNTYYKNFALVITSDDDRNGSEGNGYTEYGAIRFDATTDTATYNSQWGDYLYFKYTDCNNYMSPTDNEDALLQSMNGKVTLTVDRSDPEAFYVSISNSSITKTYNQPYPLPNLNADASDTDIRCFVVVEGSYITWASTNIEPIGGCTSALDKEPLSMVLANVPEQVSMGTALEDVVAGITATVTYEESVTGTVTADDLNFTVTSGSLDETGTIILVATYNKTVNGETAATPIAASAVIEVVETVTALEVVTQPSHTTYAYYTSEAMDGMTRPDFDFDPTGMVVMATYADGSVREIDNSYLTFSTVPAQVGTQTVTISHSDGPTATTIVTVTKPDPTTVTNSSIVGLEDNTTGWWTAFSDDFIVEAGATAVINFTNYTSMAANWDNFCVILRSADGSTTEYGVLRADNYGWNTALSSGTGYDACTTSGGQSDWSAWLADMDGAKVALYVTNCGNGAVDVQAVMESTSGTTYYQYYLNITGIDADDFSFALTCEAAHLVFE